MGTVDLGMVAFGTGRGREESGRAAPSDGPALAVHRIYPKTFKRSTSEQYDAFLPGYRDALDLCPEDVYGVWPRSVRQADDNAWAWEDYWLVYRERPQYAPGRAAWDEAIMEPDGFGERMFSSIALEAWPAAELHPGAVAPAGPQRASGRPGAGGEQHGWPRKMMVRRKRDGELGEALRNAARLARLSTPEDAFGLCPDYNGNTIFYAWRG